MALNQAVHSLTCPAGTATWVFDTKQASVVQQLTVLDALSLSRQAQCFECDIQPQLVSELEAVRQDTRGAVDLDGLTTNAMGVQSLREGLGVEAIYSDKYRQLDAVVTDTASSNARAMI